MEKTTPGGKASYYAGAAVLKGEFVKFSSGRVVKAAATGDTCIGVALDDAAADELVPVQLLTGGETVAVRSGGALAQGALLTCLGGTASGTGTQVYGVALEAATAAGTLVEAIVGLPAKI